MNKKSFTLIELMTVIGIIAILAGLMLVGYNIFFEEANIGSSMRFDSSIHHSLGYALVGDWKLDDNAANSTVVDTSGNSNDGTFYSSSTEDNTANHSVDGANGRALNFDGNTYEHVKISDNSSLDINKNKISISGWVDYENAPGLYWAILNKDEDETFGLSGRNADVYFRITTSNGIKETNQPWNSEHAILQEGWNFVVGTYDGNTMKLYLNNKNLYSVSHSGNIQTNNKDLLIGKRQYSENDALVGRLDQVRLYRGALSTSQIRNQYYIGLQRLYNQNLITKKEYQKIVFNINN